MEEKKWGEEVCGFNSVTRTGVLDVFWVSVEGPIGAGKSTLMEKMQGRLQQQYGINNVVLLPENIDELLKSGLFQQYQQEPARWAYLFQTKMFDLRTKEFLRTVKEISTYSSSSSSRTKKIIIITERSIMSGEVFMNVQRRQGNVTDMEYDTYMAMHAMWKQLYPVHPSLVIYCTPGKDSEEIVNVCQTRIDERDRDSEKSLVTKAYNKVLLEEHERMFGGGAFPIPVMRMDTTQDYKTDDRIAMKKSGEVMEAIEKHWGAGTFD